jgi:hypothetical protein
MDGLTTTSLMIETPLPSKTDSVSSGLVRVRTNDNYCFVKEGLVNVIGKRVGSDWGENWLLARYPGLKRLRFQGAPKRVSIT